MRPLRVAYEHAAFYAMLALLGVVCLAVSLPAAAANALLPPRIGGPLGRRAIMGAFRFYVAAMRSTGLAEFDLKALDALGGAGPLVICPNHPSLLDAVFVISRLPEVVCIMKAELWDNRFLGGGARLAGYIRNDAPVELIKAATREVRAGRQLLIFPEGTRTDRPGPVNGFKGGFALIARAAGAPVQTVFIECNRPFLGKGWSIFRKPDFPLVYRARLGRRLAVGADARGFVAELERYFRAELGP